MILSDKQMHFEDQKNFVNVIIIIIIYKFQVIIYKFQVNDVSPHGTYGKSSNLLEESCKGKFHFDCLGIVG